MSRAEQAVERWTLGLYAERNYLRARVAQLEKVLREITELGHGYADDAPSMAKRALETEPPDEFEDDGGSGR